MFFSSSFRVKNGLTKMIPKQKIREFKEAVARFAHFENVRFVFDNKRFRKAP